MTISVIKTAINGGPNLSVTEVGLAHVMFALNCMQRRREHKKRSLATAPVYDALCLRVSTLVLVPIAEM